MTRPPFTPVKASATAYTAPEELFYKLSGRQSTHGYLRGPQQDVLREYAEKYTNASDVAFELPTGTGKTAVGLVIAESKRLCSSKVAYLSLTNQLAGQVLEESRRLGIPCADLRGTKETRNALEEGKYRTGEAVAITTYSNLFNVNPVLRESDLIVFDDAHGAEQYVADMWTVSASLFKDQDLYNSLLSALRPGLSAYQVHAILNKSGDGTVEMVDVHGHPECFSNATTVLDKATAESAVFAWRLLRNRLHCCLFLVSPFEITIRPLIPPTQTHAPFAAAKQRIYMSATLGGESDLQRAYGIQRLGMIRAKSPQWGRRYVFVPGVYVNQAEAKQIVAEVWDGMKVRRAVLLSPSERVASQTFEDLQGDMANKPTRLTAADIADSIDGFTGNTEVILGLAGRYDGLDLPDEQCRLLILSQSPAAIGSLERHLSEHWKMGPVLRKRERTRLIQGMGRCTRNATDFAIIIWLGQSLVDSATSSSLLQTFPPELAAEISWGVQQSKLAAKGPKDFVGMLLGLIGDADYRKAADADIASLQSKQQPPNPKDYEEVGMDEVRYANAIWEQDFARALGMAHTIADRIASPELSGYRAWWWYLASVPASLMGDKGVEQDALRRGSRCNVNSGWLNQLLQNRKADELDADGGIEPNAESLWDVLAKWGWAGPYFEGKIAKMLGQLKSADHASYHAGLETLGECFGAKATRVTGKGTPDVVWSFPKDFHLTLEAKTEKGPDGKLSKKDVQNANGHPDWVRANLCPDASAPSFAAIIIAPSPHPHADAVPFIGSLLYASPDEISALAESVAEGVRKLRIKFSGREFPEAAAEFSAEMRNLGLDLGSLKKGLLSRPLKQ
jgi:Type III restriction enzyme, res subunit/Helicase C-terminal domain